MPDGFRNWPQENCKDGARPNTLPLPSHPLASARRFLAEFGPCFKLGCSGLSPQTCKRTCSPPFMLSLPLPRSGHHQQRAGHKEETAAARAAAGAALPRGSQAGERELRWVWEALQKSWDVSSQKLGSLPGRLLSTHPGMFFAEQTHIRELCVQGEEGKEREWMV